MGMLRKDFALLERDDKGELIPTKIVLDTDAKEEIIIKPMPRGAIRKIFAESTLNETSKDQDKEIITSQCVDPAFTDEEVDVMKPYLVAAIVGGVLRASGIKEASDVKQGEKDLKKF